MQNSNRTVIRAAVCLGMLLAVQTLGFPQPVTGTLVNGILLITGVFVHPGWAVAVGFMSPLTGILRGIVPAAMLPAAVFIGLGNMVYILVYYGGDRSGHLLGRAGAVVLGAAAKFGLLWMAAHVVLDLPGPARVMLGLPQLGTALAGGVLAVLLGQALRRTGLFSTGDKRDRL